MFFQDCLLAAATTALELDLPPDLLPLTITSEASLLAGIESDLIGDPGWH